MIGQRLKKWTWMLDDVTLRGVVLSEDSTLMTGDPLGPVDTFDLKLDDNYRHIVALSRGNNPIPGQPVSGCIHVEAYSQAVPFNADNINHVEPWPLPDKPGDQEFMVFDHAIRQRRNLRIGDHIEITGRWVVENQHEDSCPTRWALAYPVGAPFQIGCVWMELHPFKWDRIETIRTRSTNESEIERLSLAAPIYEETFPRGGIYAFLAGVKGHVFIDDTKSNYHRELSAEINVKAPPLPAGMTPHTSLIDYRETVILNGTGLDPAQVRTATREADGIRVQASVQAPETAGNGHYADIHDPANSRSIFQADYEVSWLPRLIPVASPNSTVPVETVQAPDQVSGGTSPFIVHLRNRGPDPLLIEDLRISGDTDHVFEVVDPSERSIDPWSHSEIDCTFDPPPWTTTSDFPQQLSATLHIISSDPARRELSLRIEGRALSLPLTSTVVIDPTSLNFGEVAPGEAPTRILTVNNNGATDISIEKLTIVTTNTLGQFTAFTPVPGIIAPTGEARPIYVRYTPKQRGPVAARIVIKIITVTHSQQADLTIPVQGTGVAHRF
jgi:hypothetical protein